MVFFLSHPQQTLPGESSPDWVKKMCAAAQGSNESLEFVNNGYRDWRRNDLTTTFSAFPNPERAE
jgi:hypothetical protein